MHGLFDRGSQTHFINPCIRGLFVENPRFIHVINPGTPLPPSIPFMAVPIEELKAVQRKEAKLKKNTKNLSMTDLQALLNERRAAMDAAAIAAAAAPAADAAAPPAAAD